MAVLNVQLFGRFEVRLGEQPAAAFAGRRVRELLSYLVLHRSRPQQREALAARLWEDAPQPQARKYLRQALWQIQAELHQFASAQAARPALEVEADWLQWSTGEGLQIDVVCFEDAVHGCHGRQGPRLDEPQRERLEAAVALYRGDLLEGWYPAWCLSERERLQTELLDALEKLIAHYEACRDNERGLLHARRMLRMDPAHEMAHRHVMRLLAQAGNRTQALRQYQCCERTLMQELGVVPAAATRRLFEAIREDRCGAAEAAAADADAPPAAAGNAQAAALPGTGTEPLPSLLRSLQQLQAAFARMEARLQAAMGTPPR